MHRPCARVATIPMIATIAGSLRCGRRRKLTPLRFDESRNR
jgi:hypothetical protein